MSKEMTLRRINNKRKKIFEEVRSDMESLGVYKDEFQDAIRLYVDSRLQYEAAWEEYTAGGMRSVVDCAGGVKKNPVLIAIEESRKAMTQLQDKLALNPKALDTMRQQGAPEKSDLALFLESRNGQNNE